MKTQNKFWWFVCVAITGIAIALCTIGFLFWQELAPDQRDLLMAVLKDHFAYIFAAVLLVFAAFGFALDWVFRFYIIPINQLAEQTHLLHSVNPNFKIDIDGSYDVMRLADIIRRNAEKGAALHNNVQDQIQSIRSESEAERNILSSLLEDLPQAIVACNIDGRIVLYNRKARELLAHQEIMPGVEKTPELREWLGLGRSVFDVIDRSVILPALDRIGRKLAEGYKTIEERFLVETRSRDLLPAAILPVLDCQHHLSGFILYIEDQTARLQEEKQVSGKLQSWKHQLVQAVSGIKSTSEILADEAERTTLRHHRDLIRLLSREVDLAANLLTRDDITAQWADNRPWPLTPIGALEWAGYLSQRASEVLRIDLVDTEEGLNQISIDVHHFTCGLNYIMARFKDYSGISTVQGRLYERNSWIYLDLTWEGATIDNDTLGGWTRSLPKIGDIELTIPFHEILNVHGAKLWPIRAGLPAGWAGLRLLIPVLEDALVIDINGRTTVLPDSRPEFFDFDLFKNAGQHPEMDDKPLRELIYTIFDTETTGLDPQGGDEIIALGAVRMVNARLLLTETFEQLVNPGRSLPWASIKYHGIRPEMLVDQPNIEKVVPRFYQFARDTVLVGHNVAFDMRMLQMKETRTGIRFQNPLLDTMLLSDIVHPAHQKHSLGAVADRLGIRIVGRHTALGDAIAAGEIFIKLLPLLNAKGIHTLKEARQASEKSLYARLKY